MTICEKCVMDTSDPLIIFDDNGICNHCQSRDKKAENELKTPVDFKVLSDAIKSKNVKGFDSIIGLSGGADSSYTWHIAKTYGMNPLPIHVDNGWDTEQAINNVESLTKHWGVKLQTIQLDYEKFRRLQLAFLRAGTAGIEIPTDHTIRAITYHKANENGLNTILIGTNIATESHGVISWTAGHRDWKYIKSVAESDGVDADWLPHYTYNDNAIYQLKFQEVSVLNYFDYNRKKAIEELQKVYGWQDYGDKHQESIITRFTHGYIYPRKFGFDSRRSRYSAMICSGQMTRDEALEKLSKPSYDPILMERDKIEVTKLLGLSIEEFENIMIQPPKTFWDYPSYARDNINNPVHKIGRIGYRVLKKIIK